LKNSQLTCGEAQGDLGDDALASQASLAIQLTWLANTAEQSAVLEERNRLAGEIHDSLAQFFAGIAMQLGAAKEVFKAGSGKTNTEGVWRSVCLYAKN
jgi:signal transduction histidine kinase